MYFYPDGAISSLNDFHLKLMDQLTYPAKIFHQQKAMSTYALVKHEPLLTIDQPFENSNKIEWEFFLEVIMSVLLYRCTTWTPKKLFMKKPDENTQVCSVLFSKKLFSVRN